MVPIAACVLYGVFIVLGQQYFAKRDRFRWKYILASWNFGLAAFSAIGFTRTAPWLFHMIRAYTSDEILCFDPESSYGSGSTGLWVQLFVLSKFPYVDCFDERILVEYPFHPFDLIFFSKTIVTGNFWIPSLL